MAHRIFWLIFYKFLKKSGVWHTKQQYFFDTKFLKISFKVSKTPLWNTLNGNIYTFKSIENIVKH